MGITIIYDENEIDYNAGDYVPLEYSINKIAKMETNITILPSKGESNTLYFKKNATGAIEEYIYKDGNFILINNNGGGELKIIVIPDGEDLPEVGDKNTIYLKKIETTNSNAEVRNDYTEYIFINGAYEEFGTVTGWTEWKNN